MANVFDRFIGNEAAVWLLRATVASGRASHAYLLTGPAQVGKRTLARAVAAALVCEAAATPCGACRACRLTTKDSHPDVRLVAPESGRRGIVIEQVRQLEHAAGLRPYEAEGKVFILTGVDAMTEAAANALLKTLEEPAEDTTLVLTASDVSQVLPTIASRCREIPLRPVPAPQIEAGLRERGVEPERAALLARLAGGRPGWALAAAEDPERLGEREERLAALEALLGQPPANRLAAVAAFADAAAASAALADWLGWWRDALLLSQELGDLVSNADRVERVRRLGAVHGTPACWQALARIQETRQQVDANANARLAMEALALDLPEAPSQVTEARVQQLA